MVRYCILVLRYRLQSDLRGSYSYTLQYYSIISLQYTQITILYRHSEADSPSGTGSAEVTGPHPRTRRV